MNEVTVLLSTFNGEKYIAEQLESVLAQKRVNVSILIRDDGSSDNTLKILEQYKNNDERVQYIQGKNIGPGQSFFELMRISKKTGYYAFCDQDDVWDEDKLWCAVEKLEQEEQSQPCLYYSNLRLVDENLVFLRMAHQKKIEENSKYSGFAQNNMTGCTAVFNYAALELVLNHLPDENLLHDGWMYLTCKMFGQVVYDFMPHISYRQHQDNVVGMHKTTAKEWFGRFRRLLDDSKNPRYDRAVLFLEQYEDMLDRGDREKIMEIIEYKKSFSKKLKLLFDKDIREQSKRGDLRYRLLILLGKI